MSPPLTVAEQERVRYHMGYPEVAIASSLAFGIPKPIQTMFLIENVYALILPAAVDRVRSIIQVMDGIECRMIDAQDRLAAEQLGELKLRSTQGGLSEPDALEREYCRWGYRLADVLGVPIYAYSARYQNAVNQSAGGGINTPVARS